MSRMGREQFDTAAAGLEGEVRKSLWEGLMYAGCLSLTLAGDRAVMELAPGALFDREIVFTGASGMPEGEYDLAGLEEPELESAGGVYTLTGRPYGGEGTASAGLSLSFTGAAMAVRFFAPLEPPALTPWGCLQACAQGIVEKKVTPGVTLNPRELELLPLAEELCALTGQAEVEAGEGEPDFPALTGYIEKYGYLKLLSALMEAERDFFDEMRRGRAVRKLIALFDKAEYEPLWRELYGTFRASWEGAPSRVQACIPPEELRTAREEAERRLKLRGYGGEYPDFVRTGPIRGVRLANAYGQSYFVGPERRAAFHIRCRERCEGGRLAVDYLCGAQVLRRGREPGDIFSCLFDSGGYSYAQTMGDIPGEPDLTADIAVKRAELLRLTKRERAAAGDRRVDRQLIIFLSVTMGLSFGVLFTLACALVAAVIGLVLSGPEKVLPLLSGIPWWAVFLASAVLFGTAMGWVFAALGRK